MVHLPAWIGFTLVLVVPLTLYTIQPYFTFGYRPLRAPEIIITWLILEAPLFLFMLFLGFYLDGRLHFTAWQICIPLLLLASVFFVGFIYYGFTGYLKLIQESGVVSYDVHNSLYEDIHHRYHTALNDHEDDFYHESKHYHWSNAYA